MKVALYARVSTTDKGQTVESQLVHLRDAASARGWDIYREYSDYASALDFRRRTEWRQLMDDASHSRFAAVVVFKLDRAWRSVRDMWATLDAWQLTRVAFLSLNDPIDTTTPAGIFVMNLMAALAEMERSQHIVRVKAGMERARREGKQLGRPHRWIEPERYRAAVARMRAGELSMRGTARELNIDPTILWRMLRNDAAARAQGIATERPVSE